MLLGIVVILLLILLGLSLCYAAGCSDTTPYDDDGHGCREDKTDDHG